MKNMLAHAAMLFSVLLCASSILAQRGRIGARRDKSAVEMHLGSPVMYQGGTKDLGITPSLKKSGGCYPKTPAPAYFVEFRGAGHFAWTDLTTN